MHAVVRQCLLFILLVCMQPDLCGVLPVVQGKLGELQQDAVQWPNSLKQCVAVCNSLNYVNKRKLVGDVADYEAFKACEARFLVTLWLLCCALPGRVCLACSFVVSSHSGVGQTGYV